MSNLPLQVDRIIKSYQLKLWVWCSLVLLQINLYSQINPSQWLGYAWQDAEYKNALSVASFRTDHPQTIHWLDKVELRSATKEFSLKQQEYGIRFYGNEVAEVRYRKNLEYVDNQYYQQLADDALHEALLKRYKVLGEYMLIANQRDMLGKQRSLFQKKSDYLKALFDNNLDAEIKELVQAQRKIGKIETMETTLNDQAKLLRNENTWLQEDLPDLSGFETIDPTEIRHLLLNATPPPSPVTADLAKLTQAQTKLNLQQSVLNKQSWNIFDFLQIQWRNNNNDELFKEKVSIGAGLILPYKGDRQKEKNQYALEALSLQFRKEEDEKKYQWKTDHLKQELLNIILQWENEKIKLTDFELKFNRNDLAGHPLVDSRDILFVDETIVEWQEDINQLKEKIISKYIDYLDHTRLISRPPYRNYLQSSLGLIRE